MKKRNRILKNNDFFRIIKNGKRFQTSSMYFYFTKQQEEYFRIGISVSKKVSKLAVVRNKIKRQINSILILNKFNYPLDLVIVAKKEILNKSFDHIKQEITNFMNSVIKERRSNEG